MRTELARTRELLRAALPERAFLRRDRGDALFISNAPAFEPEIPDIPGFILERAGGLMRILPDESWLAAAEEKAPPDQLSASLIRFRGMEPGAEGLQLFARGMKLLDMGGAAPENEIDAYDRALRQRAALALRGGCGGGLYGASILNHQIRKKGE